MIRGEKAFRKTVAELEKSQLLVIETYLQGMVYCWCKNCKDEDDVPKWFTARDLVGGDNFYWERTPLQAIWSWHNHNRPADAQDMAGKDLGHILKKVIIEDSRTFKTEKGYTRKYIWRD